MSTIHNAAIEPGRGSNTMGPQYAARSRRMLLAGASAQTVPCGADAAPDRNVVPILAR